MADVATPPAASPSPAKDTKAPKVKPERPDEEAYKVNLSKAEAAHKQAQEKLNAIKSKIELAQPPSKDSPVAKRQQELRGELSNIRQQQQGLKSSKGNLQEKIKSLDATLKSRIAEQKAAKGRVNFKNVEEIDREIQSLEKQVDSGTMRLVDEKKALADISSLRKQRKGFAGFDEAQKGIDDIKGQIAELRKGLDDPEAKALSEKYSTIAKELDEIKANQNEAYKNLNALRDERTKLHAEQQEKYTALRAVKDQYYQQKKAFADYEHEAYRQRKEKQKAERDAYEKEKRRKVAERKLEEASEPAYLDEILSAEGLIRYFDPSSVGTQTAAGPGKFAAQAQRTVDDSGIKGTALVKKDDREDTYFAGTGGKKGKKGKKGNNGSSPAPAADKLNLSIGIIEEFSKINVDPPMSQSDVAGVVEKLKEKLDHWKKDQERKTKENVEKAKKEIEKIEAEAQEAKAAKDASDNNNRRSKDGAKKPAQKNQAVNGDVSPRAEVAQEKDAVADAAKELKEASIEDKTQ
ncbi:nuclear segregation protein [Xylona heveae TC161]|uniref:Nuclear segregation protein n=1 Tax=Xylona heveae (strain CBS 132557 / TC161) TaxID=1328760 RepID=A0A161TG58_XYLHT|nr:nuclear segregation protein [Xylona heveae TC161]KZF25097.1 nuclear segregation protein [Xylona heveae TC161]